MIDPYQRVWEKGEVEGGDEVQKASKKNDWCDDCTAVYLATVQRLYQIVSHLKMPVDK